MTSHDFDFALLLENIVSFLDEGIVVTDNLGNVLYHNQAVYKILGIEDNKPIKRLHDIEKFNLQRAILKAAIDAGEVDAAGKPSKNIIRFEQQFKHDGRYRLVEIISRLISTQGHKEKIRLVLFRNRTDSRRMDVILNPLGKQITTQDPVMMEIISLIYQTAPTNAYILMQGESGTGKSQLARLIHSQSNRSKQPFIELNCATIPESLIDSELFGHIKDKFQAENNSRPGRFQSANMGTLFIDEVGDIPLNLQAKLLKVLQDQEIRTADSDESMHIDVRIITASNKNLKAMVDKGIFLAELFYRLAVIPITLPPLRERPGDISLLYQYFCERLVARGYPDNITCSNEAISMMMDYPWPGNVRELENAVEHGLICAIDGKVMGESLPQDVRDYNSSLKEDEKESSDYEAQHINEIETVLRMVNGNKAEAAKMLSVNRSTLWRWMQKYEIKV